MKTIAIFASGSGSNFQAFVDAKLAEDFSAEIGLLVCDKEDAYCFERAKKHGIPSFYSNPKAYSSKEAYEQAILEQLKKYDVDFIVLAGYMRLIGTTLLDAFEGRMVNIHPSLLPSFVGKDAIGQALEKGVKITGVTVHYVDAGMDTGPIIAQAAFTIEEGMTKEQVEKGIHTIEHKIYPKTVQQLIETKQTVSIN